ncbi:7tm Chemosensory receptor [Nesidiocoris tenuis]|uniref:Gustatory receptor n=1 Tax=Nesidiocoris tenuis TaxID=355587 RepID=A0ABN7AVH0_9HEMI|nr:7tm Chemosensory receptor [Nesidiocoris tenuis]
MFEPVDKVSRSGFFFKNPAGNGKFVRGGVFQPRLKGDEKTDDLSKLFKLSKLMGILPIDGSLSFSNTWIIYSIVACLSFTVASLGFKTLYLLETDDFRGKAWHKIIFYCRALVENAIIVSHVVQIVVHRQEFAQVLEEMKDSGRDHKSTVIRFFAPAGYGVLAANIIAICAFESSSPTSTRANLSSAASEMLCFTILVQFCTALGVFRTEIETLTKRIAVNQAKLEMLADRRQRILEIAGMTNDIFSIQLLFICFKLFTDIINFAYFTIIRIKDLTTMNDGAVITSVIRMPLFAVWKIFELYSISASTEQLVETAEDFNAELFQLMRDNKELCKNKKLSLCLALKNTVNFTACGFFTLGYPLVTSVIAAATTYLVILVQFSI